METINLLGSICSIVSLLVTLFIASRVYKISVSIRSTRNDPTKSDQTGNIVGGDIAGRDIHK